MQKFNKLSRAEMKNVVGGQEDPNTCSGSCSQTVSTPGGDRTSTDDCTGLACTCGLVGTVYSNTCKTAN